MPSFDEETLRIPVLHATSYLYKAGFFAMAITKFKYSSRIGVEREMSCSFKGSLKVPRSFQK